MKLLKLDEFFIPVVSDVSIDLLTITTLFTQFNYEPTLRMRNAFLFRPQMSGMRFIDPSNKQFSFLNELKPSTC